MVISIASTTVPKEGSPCQQQKYHLRTSLKYEFLGPIPSLCIRNSDGAGKIPEYSCRSACFPNRGSSKRMGDGPKMLLRGQALPPSRPQLAELRSFLCSEELIYHLNID